MQVTSKQEFINKVLLNAVEPEFPTDIEVSNAGLDYQEYLEAIKTEVRALLFQTTVKIVFTKVDGSERTMFATLNPTIIDASIESVEVDPTKPIKERKENPNTQRVLDTEINEFRAFNWDRLKTYEAIITE